jgi:hypothetical protein
LSGKVYNEVVEITRDYLGPAADRFLARQIRFHLKKVPDKLSVNDIPRLVEWVSVSIAILTEDRKLVDENTSRIKSLTEDK